MFQVLLVLSAVVAVVVGQAPYIRPPGFIPILSQQFDLNPDGSYIFK